jgi:glycosyltransferase involved in cell wall biosynthesis
MNILQINVICGAAGTGRVATDLHAVLASKGHASTIAYGRPPALSCDRTIRVGREIDRYRHCVRTRLFDAHGFGSAGPTKALLAEIRALDPDLIHLHNLHGYYLHVGLLFEYYLKSAGKPVVWTLHDCWSFTGHCSHFEFVGCDRWKTGCFACPEKRRYPASYFLDRSKSNYFRKQKVFTGVPDMTIVAPSRWLEKLVRQSFLRDYPVVTIHNGIDLGEFKPTAGGFRARHDLQGQFILLGVAHDWTDRKGLGYFVELAKQRRPDETIVVLGLTPRQLRQLPEGILGFARTRSTAELVEIFSAADLFVNPTLQDTFPTTNLEAMACGTPVITFRSGGSPECLADGCGMVVERGDFPGLVNAIAAMRKAGKAVYSARCRKHVEEHFDKNARFAEYLKLYEERLESRNEKTLSGANRRLS